ncbi:capsular associated protein [Phakopsora pachyrhizi]|uniref:Capsular associated protein n=1 Tax=Phakopsora pachyrhizi TaxID=170000 RepID=A0AAV0BRC4_PHAPC|nr:capsular associated protein [Phakopsora pachyrhizi]CAH7688749.1 capsular associated protein [Phakopsora pachyrhizi]
MMRTTGSTIHHSTPPTPPTPTPTPPASSTSTSSSSTLASIPSSSKRKLSLLIIIIIFSLIITITSFILVIIPSSGSSLNQSQSIRSFSKTFNDLIINQSPRQLSADISNWFDSVPTRLRPLVDHISDYYSYYYQHHLKPYSLSNQQSQLSSDSPLSTPHPILPLLLSSRATWRSILTSQPTSLEDARQDYINRYRPLKPPPGFDQWYSFAISKNFTLINRFDSLMHDLNRFRNVSTIELRRRTTELNRLDGVTMVRINPDLSTESRTSSARFSPGQSIKSIIDNIIKNSDWRPELSEPIELAINEHSQPKILPRLSRSVLEEEFDYLPGSVRDQFAAQDPENNPSLKGYKPKWGQDGSVWDAYRRACPLGSTARRWVETLRSAESQTGAVAAGGGWSSSSSDSNDQKRLSLRPMTRRRTSHPSATAPVPSRTELTFLPDLESKASFCDQPSTHHLHSAFFTDQRSIEHLYPLFSPSKPQGFADILIPSHYHYDPTPEFSYESEFKRGLNPLPTDKEWSHKLDKMYWHGKMTRGANTPPGHMSSFQKQRLVKLVSNDTDSVSNSAAHKQGESDPSRRFLTDRVLLTLNTSSSALVSVSESATVIDPLLLDIAIACDPDAGECKSYDAQGYLTQPPLPLSEAWKHKMVLDIDDVGFSPLFGALMESRSAVVKMSVHQEFWRDWVQPWYHFIPLSSSYAEIHNLISFFVGIPKALIQKIQTIKYYNNSLNNNSNDNNNKPSKKIRVARSIINFKNFNDNDNLKVVNKDDHNGADSDDDLKGFNGDEVLKRLGENGRDWKLRHMRKDDMEVYMFRLLIEWARILNPTQET